MNDHVFERHLSCMVDHCPICDGGLAVCVVCGLAEGELGPACPGISEAKLKRALQDAGFLNDESPYMARGTLASFRALWRAAQTAPGRTISREELRLAVDASMIGSVSYLNGQGLVGNDQPTVAQLKGSIEAGVRAALLQVGTAVRE